MAFRSASRVAQTGRFIVNAQTPQTERLISKPRVGRSPRVTVTGSKFSRPEEPLELLVVERSERASNDEVRRVQVEAAKLRQITDRKLGKATPKWVERLAGKRA